MVVGSPKILSGRSKGNQGHQAGRPKNRLLVRGIVALCATDWRECYRLGVQSHLRVSGVFRDVRRLQEVVLSSTTTSYQRRLAGANLGALPRQRICHTVCEIPSIEVLRF